MHCTKRLLRRWEGEILLWVPEILFRVPEILLRVPEILFRVPKILFRVPEILLRVPEILFRVQSSKDFVQSSRDFVQSSRQESSGAPHKLIQEEINFAQYKLNKMTQIYISLVVVHTIFVLLDLLRHLVRSNNFDGCDYPMWWWSTAKTKSIHYHH